MKKHYKETIIYKQWLNIKQKCKCIVLFQMGEFYEFFEDDAVLVAPILGVTLTKRNKKDADSMPLAGFPLQMLSAYASKLLDVGFKIAICNQDNRLKTSNIVSRSITRCISPGTILEEEGLVSEQNNKISAIVIGELDISIASIEWSTGRFTVDVFSDYERAVDSLRSCETNEIVILEKQEPKLTSILNHCQKEKKFISTVKSIKNNHIEEMNMNNKTIMDIESAKTSCNLILEYIIDTQTCIPKHINFVNLEVSNKFLLVDNNTLKNTNIMNTDNLCEKKSNLFYFLKKEMFTSMGKRRLVNIIKRPLIDKNDILYRQRLVTFFIESPQVYDQIKNIICNIIDIERFYGKCGTSRIKAEDLYSFKNTLLHIKEIANLLSTHGKSNESAKDFIKISDDYENILTLLKNTFKETQAKFVYDYDSFLQYDDLSLFKNGYSKELDQIVSTISNCLEDLNRMERLEQTRTLIKSLKIKEGRQEGFYISVSKSKKNLDIVNKNYSLFSVLTSNMKIKTNELSKISELLSASRKRKKDLESFLIENLSFKILKYSRFFTDLGKKISLLDVIMCFSKVSIENNYIKPLILDSSDNKIILKEARHPVIEFMIKNNRYHNDICIPNDVSLDKNTRAILITGANMGGKTTIMKMMIIIQILSQIGCFIPASEGQISICDKIFSSIGSSDNIEKGHSTFMVECSNISYICNNSTSFSLVMLDEIGQGTSRSDGIVFTAAVIDYIVVFLNSRLICTTHNYELSKLENINKMIKNYHMSLEELNGKIHFPYLLTRGASNESYCFKIASMSGIPNEILKKAEILKKTL